MVNINPNASSLQAQLQAQLQAGKTGVRPKSSGVETAPTPKKTIIDERIAARRDDSGSSRRLPVKQANHTSDLSTSQELSSAKERVRQVASNNREAPTGRTSTRQNDLRNQPLGQIIDIRV